MNKHPRRYSQHVNIKGDHERFCTNSSNNLYVQPAHSDLPTLESISDILAACQAPGDDPKLCNARRFFWPMPRATPREIFVVPKEIINCANAPNPQSSETKASPNLGCPMFFQCGSTGKKNGEFRQYKSGNQGSITLFTTVYGKGVNHKKIDATQYCSVSEGSATTKTTCKRQPSNSHSTSSPQTEKVRETVPDLSYTNSKEICSRPMAFVRSGFFEVERLPKGYAKYPKLTLKPSSSIPVLSFERDQKAICVYSIPKWKVVNYLNIVDNFITGVSYSCNTFILSVTSCSLCSLHFIVKPIPCNTTDQNTNGPVHHCCNYDCKNLDETTHLFLKKEDHMYIFETLVYVKTLANINTFNFDGVVRYQNLGDTPVGPASDKFIPVKTCSTSRHNKYKLCSRQCTPSVDHIRHRITLGAHCETLSVFHLTDCDFKMHELRDLIFNIASISPVDNACEGSYQIPVVLAEASVFYPCDAGISLNSVSLPQFFWSDTRHHFHIYSARMASYFDGTKSSSRISYYNSSDYSLQPHLDKERTLFSALPSPNHAHSQPCRHPTQPGATFTHRKHWILLHKRDEGKDFISKHQQDITFSQSTISDGQFNENSPEHHHSQTFTNSKHSCSTKADATQKTLRDNDFSFPQSLRKWCIVLPVMSIVFSTFCLLLTKISSPSRHSERFAVRLASSKSRPLDVSSSWRAAWLFLMLLVNSSLWLGLPAVSGQGLVGTISTCDNEGENVQVPGITDDPCISCFCRSGQVTCETRQCPKLEGCHAILFGQPSRMCCEVCKGCRYKGRQYESGLSWVDQKNPCKQLSCRAGVITVSKVQCFTPCSRPLPPADGQCCPVCKGCFFRGVTYSEGAKFTLPTDNCTSCKCLKGNLVCERKQCPVLNCPAEVIYQPENECCPMCRGMRRIFDVQSKCYFAKQLYKRRSKFSPTECAECVCKAATSVCKTKTCPALDCPETDRISLEGSPCCQVCLQKRPCQFAGETYKHREHWRPNICMTCSCEDGKTYCSRQKCNNSLWCPPGYRLKLSREQCCPRCVEHDAVCSVFGDPHYRTFDGFTYSFQGTCKYTLAQTCTTHEPPTAAAVDRRTKPKNASSSSTRERGGRDKSVRSKFHQDETGLDFLIKVRNGVRFSSGFAWTQMLVVLVAGHRISLLQGGVVKVDRRRVRRLPHSVPGKFSITRAGGILKLRTTIGLQVSWDGDSFAEVTVTTRFKFKVCGLCGNYNGVKADDLLGPDGTLHATGQEMGHAWRVGGTRACKSRAHLLDTQPLCVHDTQARQRAHRVCSVFYGRAFARCRQMVQVDVYVSSCITDMCDCPKGRYCACEAIRAYTSQCHRAGAKVKWDRISYNCHVSQPCPEDASRADCAEICPGTCERTGSETPCPALCPDDCLCSDQAKVFHDGRCVLQEDCPAWERRPAG